MARKAAPRRASDNRLEKLQALADMAARCRRMDELEHRSLAGSVARDILDALIDEARDLSDERPGMPIGMSPVQQAAETLTIAGRLTSEAVKLLRKMADSETPAAIKALTCKPIITDPDPFDYETPDCTAGLRFEAEPDQRQLEDEAYGYSTGAKGDDCTACKGTGEVVDYPPDDDERLIACGHCGGTGEQIL